MMCACILLLKQCPLDITSRLPTVHTIASTAIGTWGISRYCRGYLVTLDKFIANVSPVYMFYNILA